MTINAPLTPNAAKEREKAKYAAIENKKIDDKKQMVVMLKYRSLS